jgi:tRNA (cmo5U34)-methyltransferase
MQKDSIYAQPKQLVADFTFDETVAAVFPDMIKRSVPAYPQMVAYTALWAERYAQPKTNLYDLGCSLGATSFAMRGRVGEANCRIVGVDNSADMLARARQILASEPDGIPVDLVEADIRDVAIENASVVVLNFTLQFIDPAERTTLLEKICRGLLPNGILVLSEKVVFADPAYNQRIIDLHHDFKRANGYSDLEIAQKRTAIMDVLVPETLEAHTGRLLGVGFQSAETWFQAFNFASIIAIK